MPLRSHSRIVLLALSVLAGPAAAYPEVQTSLSAQEPPVPGFIHADPAAVLGPRGGAGAIIRIGAAPGAPLSPAAPTGAGLTPGGL